MTWLTGRLAAAGATLKGTSRYYSADAGAGAFISGLSKPFGLGTTYQRVSGDPQLDVSGGHVVAGVSEAAAETTYSVKVRAISSDGAREIAETITFIAKTPITVSTGDLPDATPGVPYVANVAIVGGTPPFTGLTLLSGALPDWASMELVAPRTLRISGNPA